MPTSARAPSSSTTTASTSTTPRSGRRPSSAPARCSSGPARSARVPTSRPGRRGRRRGRPGGVLRGGVGGDGAGAAGGDRHRPGPPAQRPGVGLQATRRDEDGRRGPPGGRRRHNGGTFPSIVGRPARGSAVTGIKTTGEKTLMLFSGRAHPELAEEIATAIGIGVSPTDLRDFADGEIYARFQESVRGCDAFVVESMTTPVNEWIMETLVMCDALKRGSAKRITVVVPYYPYARQDKKSRGREPISARLIADLYKTAGADRILTVDLHTSQIQGFFDGPVDHLFALPMLADHVAASYDLSNITVVAPDSGRVRVAERWTERLGGTPLGV